MFVHYFIYVPSQSPTVVIYIFTLLWKSARFKNYFCHGNNNVSECTIIKLGSLGDRLRSQLSVILINCAQPRTCT